ncbi:glycoside-pentoside-hexuronide (GPH):cation symporter [Bacillus rhizoplanae]|uniref:glycoside-pentoside-hexuronide (GPH):cation symporter n=1 Tax=Bacillus rhizoplanae TaxID=2880966 RepID=UPI003D1EC685
MKVSSKTVLSYGLGSLGQNLVYILTVSYLMLFYTDYYGISAAAVGTLFLVARLLDALLDPFIGIMVDNTKSRWGKFRPYLLLPPVIMAGFTVLCFLQPNISPAAKIIYASVTYIMWGMGYGLVDVPYWSMTSAITDDSKERTKVVMVPRVMAIIAVLFVSVFTLPLVKALHSWVLVSSIYAVLCIGFFWITFFNVKEQVTVARNEKFTFKDAFRVIKLNQPLLLLLLTMLMEDIVTKFRGAFGIYYFKYYLHAENLFPVFSFVSIVPVLIGGLLAPTISKRLGKKKTTIIGIIGYGVEHIALFFVGKNMIPFFTLNILGGLFFGIATITMSAMIADCVEYGEWKTGKRAEGTVFSTNTFRAKFAGAIGGGIGAYALSGIGYIPNQTQAGTTMVWMQLFFTLIPGILLLISVIPLMKYRLTEGAYEKILSEIKIRRKSSTTEFKNDVKAQ